MTTLIHCADLHLTASDTAEQTYCLNVLDEIIAIARNEQASALLFCGDLFDRFADIEILRTEFRSRIKALASHCTVVYIAGNHEPHGSNGRRINSFDLGIAPDNLIEQSPYRILSLTTCELLCIPHQQSYDGYREWHIPACQAPHRIALAHGLVTGMDIYSGPTGKECDMAGVLDPDLFNRFGVSYAALGHIHARREKTAGQTTLCYAGSARVFRKGENGDHGVYLLRIGDTIHADYRPLASAGSFREHELALRLDGGLDGLDELSRTWMSSDWIHLRFNGVVDDENTVGNLERDLRERFQHTQRVRRLDIDRSDVTVLAGISRHPLARDFLAAWQNGFASEGAGNEALWMRARQIGLKKIAELAGRNA